MSVSLRSLGRLRAVEVAQLREVGVATVRKYAAHVGCSEATARARLNRLADEGYARRVREGSGRGGAFHYEAVSS
ncbi:MAG TPA: hypothetical protein VMB05_14595 [Solirubrobacteraceae bacterium]|nr:hypothetical protein [Solirubrobacteraceae bacterium]